MLAIINNGTPCICNDYGSIMTRLYPNGARCVCMSPNQKYLVAGYDDGVRVFSLPYGGLQSIITSIHGPVCAISFRDEQSFAISYSKGGGSIYNVNGGQLACFI